MWCIGKAFGALLSVLGLSGVVSHFLVDPTTFASAQEAILVKLGRTGLLGKSELPVEGVKSHPPVQHTQGEPQQGHGMASVRACHMRCGANRECHKKCPNPWAHLQQRCEKMEHIMACHQSCGCNHDCHVKCPMPECPRMQGLINATLKCHGACAADRACHSTCPKPFLEIRESCAALDKAMQCHKACQPGDHACHHACPRAMHGHHHLGHGHHHHHHAGGYDFHNQHSGDGFGHHFHGESNQFVSIEGVHV